LVLVVVSQPPILFLLFFFIFHSYEQNFTFVNKISSTRIENGKRSSKISTGNRKGAVRKTI